MFSYVIFHTGCEQQPQSILDDQAFYEQAQATLEEFDSAIGNFTDGATEFCGTTDTTLFADIISTSLKYLCGVMGLALDIRTVFQCKTWLPLYYNTGTLWAAFPLGYIKKGWTHKYCRIFDLLIL